MLNGDSVAGSGWYHELVIVPDPGDDSMYYVFSIGVTYSIGMLYSVVDMRGDNGLGAVVQKNIPLLNNMRMVDCLTAIKHGNGRDWWLIARESTVHLGTSNNTWYLYLISPSGISSLPIQNVGSLNSTNAGRLSFNPVNNKICFINTISMIEIYDFDRCTGILSNPVNIETEFSTIPNPYYWSSEFSPSGRYLYVTSSTVNGILWQFDTWAPNIPASKTLIWQMTFPPATIGALKRGPDNKIYLSCAWSDSTGIFNYPYPPTAYYTENMNLSVINSPDSAGLACDFQPWSFYLGGKRTYWGLPNNPDYDLGPLVGSLCDTLVSINGPASISSISNLHVYYAPDWEKAFINADNLKGKNYRLRMIEVLGKEVYSESGVLNSPYFTRDLNCASFASGIYLILFETESERLVKKMQVNWR
ncbi:MAG: hypothetical protein IPP71_01665 [Bacteroidetes bacterium]|nr:hypothetical protein [Bacteroidota bacterium]